MIPAPYGICALQLGMQPPDQKPIDPLPARVEKLPPFVEEVLWAWLAATVLSGIPSSVYAWLAGGDVTEATRAAGMMLVRGTLPVGCCLRGPP